MKTQSVARRTLISAISLLATITLPQRYTFSEDVSGASITEERIIANESYKADATTAYERERCKLDWYLPKGDKGFPTIVWFHGGGLQNGDKAGGGQSAMAKRFASEGIAVVSVNYRLSPKVEFPAYIEDAAAAVAYVVKNVSRFGGSDDRVFVSGHSAGGYLTSMVGLDARYLGDHGIDRTALAGFIPVSGQMITHSTVRSERGIPRSQPIIDEAAPAFYATAETSPFLCIVGSRDLPARAEENRYFAAVMKAAGNLNVRYLEVDGRDHSTIANRMSQSDDIVAEQIKRFIDENKKPSVRD